jgi:hypothetical protein
MGESMNTGLLATILIFVLAAIFGLVLWSDAKKTRKSEKAPGAPAKPRIPPTVAEVKTQPDSWEKSAERFKRSASQTRAEE